MPIRDGDAGDPGRGQSGPIGVLAQGRTCEIEQDRVGIANSKPEPDRAAVARDQERIAELVAHVGADPRLGQARRPVLIEQRKQRIGRANREAAAARQDVLDRIQGNRLLMPWTPPAPIPTDDGTPPNSVAPLFLIVPSCHELASVRGPGDSRQITTSIDACRVGRKGKAEIGGLVDVDRRAIE